MLVIVGVTVSVEVIVGVIVAVGVKVGVVVLVVVAVWVTVLVIVGVTVKVGVTVGVWVGVLVIVGVFVVVGVDGVPSKAKTVEQKKRRFMGDFDKNIKKLILENHKEELNVNRNKKTLFNKYL